MSFYVSTGTFVLLHCDEWDRVVALPRHKFVTGATLLQLVITVKVILLSWLFGRNTCKFVVPWRYDKTRINCNGLLNLSNELEKKKTVIFSYAMVNLGILKTTFNCFLTYKAIQTRPLVLLVDLPYKSCIAPPSDPPRACWCQCTWYKWYFFQCKWRYKRRRKMMIMKKI